jgi:hypothetical protein
LEGLATVDVGVFCGHMVLFTAIWYILWTFGIFCGHLVFFVDIWYILWTFGIFCGHLVFFSRFWYAAPRKIWQPCLGQDAKKETVLRRNPNSVHCS